MYTVIFPTGDRINDHSTQSQNSTNDLLVYVVR